MVSPVSNVSVCDTPGANDTGTILLSTVVPSTYSVVVCPDVASAFPMFVTV